MTYCDACASGFYRSANNDQNCSSCLAGQYSVASAAKCTVCDPGRFQSGFTKSSCAACGQGRYAPDAAAQKCEHCKAGKYTKYTAAQRCEDCKAGQYGNEPQQSRCKMCPKHYYQGDSSQQDCTACDKGEFNNAAGQVTCEQVAKADMYIVERITAQGELEIEQKQCPNLGLVKEAECANGILTYKQGYWHDGLEQTAEGKYQHRSVVLGCKEDVRVSQKYPCTCMAESELSSPYSCPNGTTYALRGPDADGEGGTRFYTCPCRECCNVDTAIGNVTCLHNTDGLLCAKCKEG